MSGRWASIFGRELRRASLNRKRRTASMSSGAPAGPRASMRSTTYPRSRKAKADDQRGQTGVFGEAIADAPPEGDAQGDDSALVGLHILRKLSQPG